MASQGHGGPRTIPTPEDPANFMDTLREMAYAMREQPATTHQMMDQLGRQPKGGCGGNPNGPEVDLEYLKFVGFRKANPPSFRGTLNLDKADKWIKAMEKIFSVLGCTDY